MGEGGPLGMLSDVSDPDSVDSPKSVESKG